jgi:hypothetical protein
MFGDIQLAKITLNSLVWGDLASILVHGWNSPFVLPDPLTTTECHT